MTGCGCVLLVALLAALFYLFTFGASDTGEQVEQAVAVVVGLYWLARTRPGPKGTGEDERRQYGRSPYALSAIAGRRVPQLIARS